MRIQLAAAVSLAPLMMASGAAAQTVISTERTTPVVSSTVNNGAPDNIRISSSGVIRLPSGVGVTLNSNNTLAIDAGGRIIFENAASGSTGILVNGGVTGGVTNAGQISITDNYTPTDTDNDGDLDGPFATGTGRFGIRVTGPGAFTGSITNATGSLITVEGNQSAGVFIESDLVGDYRQYGTISVLGDQSYAARVTGQVTGGVYTTGALSVQGAGSTAVSLEGNINGRVTLSGVITATGYRYISGVPTASIPLLDADDLLQGGPAVSISGNVSGGLLLDRPYVNDPDDTDDDDDGILDVNDTDSNNNGIPDVSESTSNITVYGSAPAVQVGSLTQTVTLGAVGTGDAAYGFINRGNITAAGVYENVSTTGVRLGVAGGQAVTITGGMRNEGALRASSFNADATGVEILAGVNLGRLVNTNVLTAFSSGDDVYEVVGVDIQAGSTVTELINRGFLQAQVFGEHGSAYGIRDASGTLASITNSGIIQGVVVPNDGASDTDDADDDPSNEVVTGSSVAIDVSANTTGVTIIQEGVAPDVVTGLPDADNDGIPDANEPAIYGEVRFGSGDDVLDVRNGVVIGDISFGAGADTLSITGGGLVNGAITDLDGQLQIDVTNGTLSATQATATTISGLNLGANGVLIATVDPADNTSGGFIVNGTANVANGAGVGVNFTSLLDDPTRFVIVQATTLNAGTIDQTRVQANSPYMFVVNAGVDNALNQIYIDARQRTSAEFGFIASEDATYGAFYENLASDPALLTAFLQSANREQFFELYEQMLPDHSGGALMSLATGVDAVTRGLSGRSFPAGDGETSAWLQEINFYADKDKGQAYGFRSDGFGLAGGVERGTGLGAFGVSLALTSSDLEDPESAGEEAISSQLLELGLYWRAQGAHLNTWARGAVGYASFDSVRQLVGPNINRRNESDWNGYSIALAAGASYDYRRGRYSIRPEGIVEYFRLSEDAHEETGGGDGFDLAIEDRTGHILSSTIALNLGAGFGENQWLRPEVRVGWRQIWSHDPGDTVARFRATGTPFTLTGDSLEGGGPIVGFRLNLGNDLGFLAVEGDAEMIDDYVRYALLLRASFRF